MQLMMAGFLLETTEEIMCLSLSLQFVIQNKIYEVSIRKFNMF